MLAFILSLATANFTDTLAYMDRNPQASNGFKKKIPRLVSIMEGPSGDAQGSQAGALPLFAIAQFVFVCCTFNFTFHKTSFEHTCVLFQCRAMPR